MPARQVLHAFRNIDNEPEQDSVTRVMKHREHGLERAFFAEGNNDVYGVAGRGVHPDKAEDVGVVELRHDFGFLDQFIILIPELACADAGLKHFHRNGLKGGEKEGKWARIGCNIKMYRLDGLDGLDG